MAQTLDVEKLEREVKNVYRDVAETPDGEFHFEMGRDLAERLDCVAVASLSRRIGRC